jgi:hypothetical protein
MTRGEHGHPQEEGYGKTHVDEIAGRSVRTEGSS